jgi:hypothetical protein
MEYWKKREIQKKNNLTTKFRIQKNYFYIH